MDAVYRSQAAISPVTTNRASQPSACPTPTSGCSFIQIAFIPITGTGAASHAMTAMRSAPLIEASALAQTQRKMNAAQLTTPSAVDAAMELVSLSPGFSRHTSGVSEYFRWKRKPMKNQSVNMVATPEATTASTNRVQFMGASVSVKSQLAATNTM